MPILNWIKSKGRIRRGWSWSGTQTGPPGSNRQQVRCRHCRAEQAMRQSTPHHPPVRAPRSNSPHLRRDRLTSHCRRAQPARTVKIIHACPHTRRQHLTLYRTAARRVGPWYVNRHRAPAPAPGGRRAVGWRARLNSAETKQYSR